MQQVRDWNLPDLNFNRKKESKHISSTWVFKKKLVIAMRVRKFEIQIFFLQQQTQLDGWIVSDEDSIDNRMNRSTTIDS